MVGVARQRLAAAVAVGTDLQAAGGSKGKRRLTGCGWGRWAGRQKEAFKVPSPPAGEQWCGKSALSPYVPAQW